MFNEFDTPLFKKSYDLYRMFYNHKDNIKRQDRYTIWQKIENTALEIVENILLAGHMQKTEKLPTLEKTSQKLNLLRVLVRLCKDNKVIDNQRYIDYQTEIDEIGKMVGGWIKSTKNS
jgi:four helix bundle protein